MKLLLDTHLLLWAAEASDRLPARALELIEDAANTPVFSVASLWEVAIKHARGREDFDVDPSLLRRCLLDNQYEELPILGQHALTVARLEPIHGDPFDRILVAQAMCEELPLLTSDVKIARYPGPIELLR